MNGGMYPVLMVTATPTYFSVDDNVFPSPCSHLKIIPLIFATQHLLKTSYIPYLSNSMIYIKSLCLLYIPAKLFSFKIQNHLYGILLGPFYLFGRTSYHITLRLLIVNLSDPDVCSVQLLQTVNLLLPYRFLLLRVFHDVQLAFSPVQVLLLSTAPSILLLLHYHGPPAVRIWTRPHRPDP